MIKKFLMFAAITVNFTVSSFAIYPAFAVENKENKIKSLKANMHTFQVMVETHGVDWEGLYPNTVSDLKKQATLEETMYWKSLTNPFSSKKDIGASMIDFNTYNTSKNKSESYKGAVVYQPLDCQENPTKKISLCKNYKIYGLDDKGNMIQDENEEFYLSNQVASVKGNMHSLQMMVEKYGIDWKGSYPDTVADLHKQATLKSTMYWKNLMNPVTEKTDINTDINEIMLDFNTYNTLKAKPESVKGKVVYQPLNCQEDKNQKRNLCKHYKIYGLDEKGEMLRYNGQNFYLDN